MLIICLLFSTSNLLFAAKKKIKVKKKNYRIYNPPQTKANAIAKLQASNELSELAKIESTTSTNCESLVYQKENPLQYANQTLSDVEILKTFLSAEEVMNTEYGDEGEDLAEL